MKYDLSLDHFQVIFTSNGTTLGDCPIMFNIFKKSRKVTQPEGYEDGKRLFDMAVAAAQQEKFHEAFLLYSESIAACPNPAPYLNRARILVKKIRHKEALDDLIEAQRTDRLQGKEFQSEIRCEIQAVSPFVENYRNGTREKLISDFRSHADSIYDLRHVATRIFEVSFGLEPGALYPFNGPLAEYHFFNELDNIARFEDVEVYPEAKEFLGLYTTEFIAEQVNGTVDIEAYSRAEATLNSFLCSYDEPDMRQLRRLMLYSIHQDLIIRDYGDQLWAMDNPQPKVIRSAAHLTSALE